jgi:hypothetical protein
MRKASTLLGLVVLTTLVALAATAHAQEAVPTAETTTAAPVPARRLHVGVTFLPMALGKFIVKGTGVETTSDAAFAYGAALSVGYDVIRHLTVGLAPQVILHVTPKDDMSIISKEIDAMARIAYSFPIAQGTAIYVELLPGYSLVMPSAGDAAKGFIIGGGAGAVMDLGDRFYVSLGAGRQVGYQSRTEGTMKFDVRTDYYRVALGFGARF